MATTSGLLALDVHQTIVAGGVPIDGVALGDPTDASTWKVTPPEQQAAAQAIIDTYAKTQPERDTAAQAKARESALATEIGEIALGAVIVALTEAGVKVPPVEELKQKLAAKSADPGSVAVIDVGPIGGVR